MLIGTLPPDLSTAMLVETHRHGDYTGLKLFVKEHIQIMTDQIERVKGIKPVNAIGEGNEASGSAYPRGISEGENGSSRSTGGSENGDVFYEECDMLPEQILEVNALMANSGGRKRFVPRGASGGGGGRPAPRVTPPRNPQEMMLQL